MLEASGHPLTINPYWHTFVLTRLGCYGLVVIWSYNPEVIMKLGRWQTQAFLTYIHSQIVGFAPRPPLVRWGLKSLSTTWVHLGEITNRWTVQ